MGGLDFTLPDFSYFFTGVKPDISGLETFAKKTGETANNISTAVTAFCNSKLQALLSPPWAKRLEGFVFDVPKDTTLNMDTDVTDYPIESGSHIQDHAVHQPLKLTLSGYVGELVYENPKDPISILGNDITTKLGTVSAYLGDATPQAVQQAQGMITQAQYVANQAKSIMKRAKNVTDWFSKDIGSAKTKQEKAFQQLLVLRGNRVLLRCVTPWGFIRNLMITNVSFTQGEDSASYSDITITLKQVVFVGTQVIPYNKDLFPNKTDAQKASTDSGEAGAMTLSPASENSVLRGILPGAPK